MHAWVFSRLIKLNSCFFLYVLMMMMMMMMMTMIIIIMIIKIMILIIMIMITIIPIIVGSLGCAKSNLDKALKDLSIEAECRSHTL